MVGSRSPFVLQGLGSSGPPLTVSTIQDLLFAGDRAVTITVDRAMVPSGATDPTRFVATRAGGPLVPSSANRAGNQINLVFPGPDPLTNLEYLGPPPNITAADGGLLGAFDLAVPFP